MLVVATRKGFYGKGGDAERKYPAGYPDPRSPIPAAGKPFPLLKKEDFSPRWMQFKDGTPEERKYAEAKVEAFNKRKQDGKE